MKILILIACVVLAGTAYGQMWDPRVLAIDPATAKEPVAPVLEGVGNLHHPVTTSNPQSQAFFDQGLRLTYAFNHSEAVRAFKEAARLDPDNAMAYWGWAYALGPNINLVMMPEVTGQAYAAAQKAMSLRDKVSAGERDYIEALAKRYADPAPEDRSSLDRAYAEAMRDVAAKHPADPDAATIYVDALMNLSPWNYWNPDGSPLENTDVIVDTLEGVLRRHPDHMGALHLHIHALEAVDGKRAETSADRLLRMAPAAGHLVHMPSHIYMTVGRYADSYDANALADAADDRYVASCNAQGFYPLFLHRHNQHFQTWAAMFQGRSADAMRVGRKISVGLEPAMVAGPFSETFQHLMSQPLYVMVRFGEWNAILKEPQPAADYGFMNAIWHYARGMAYRNTGNAGAAKKELRALREAASGPAMKDKFVGFASAPGVLAIATEILSGEIASAGGDRDAAIVHLERAVRLQDGLRYDEPPDWYFPARHYLGAELLDAGRPAEAETVYWQDLAHNPANGYALFGLGKAQAAQGKKAEAEHTASQFATAWKAADVKLTSSRF